MSVPRWICVPSGSTRTGPVGSTFGITQYWPKMAAAIALSGMFGHGVTLSSRLMRIVASMPVTRGGDPPGRSEYTTRCSVT